MTLRRVLSRRDAAWLVAGNMIGSGIFFAPGWVARELPGLGWPLAAWLLGGALALAGAAVYGELGARVPAAGGDYEYLSRAYGPFWGFLNGWAAITLTFSAAAAVQVAAALSYLAAAIPGIGDLPAAATRALATGVLLALTWANTVGARVSGRATAWLTALPLVGLLLLFGYGVAAGRAEIRRPHVDLQLDGDFVVGFGAAMVSIYFAYSGWNAAAYLAGEMRDPQKRLGGALLWGTGLVVLLYLGVNAVVLLTLPPEQLQVTEQAGADAAARLIGSRGESLLGLVIGTAILGSANVTLMAGGRVYYAMACRGLLPSALTRTNQAGVPAAALWVGGLWSIVLGWIGKIEDLLNWATLAILLLSSLAVIALFVFRRREPRHEGFRCPGYPLTPLLYLCVSLFVAVSVALHSPVSSAKGLAFIAAGALVYPLLRRFVPRPAV